MQLEFLVQASSADAVFVEDVIAAEELTVESIAREESPSRVAGAEVLLILIIVIVGATAVDHLANVVHRIRQKLRPMTILDLTQDEPRLSIIDNAPGMGGKFVVKTNEGDQLIDLSDDSQLEIAEVIRAFLSPGS